MDDPSARKEFALKEYEALRHEIADAVKESRSVERYAVTVTAAIWTWLLTHVPDDRWEEFIEWIPMVFCLIAAIRSGALLFSIKLLGDYIRDVEGRWGPNTDFSWERFVEEKRWHLTATAILIWSILIFGNIYLALKVNS
jgi:hypothetical protein